MLHLVFETKQALRMPTMLFFAPRRHVPFALALGLMLSGCAPPPTPSTGKGATLQQGYTPRNHNRAGEAIRPPLRPTWVLKGLGGVTGGIVGQKGDLFVPTLRGQLIKLQAATGKILWRYTVPGGKTIRGTPALLPGRVCFGNDDGRLRCLSPQTGKLLFSVKTDDAIEHGIKWQGRTLFFESLDSNVYAVSALSGKVLWQKASNFWLKGAPALDGNTLYMGGIDGRLRSLNTHGGGENWFIDMKTPFYGAPLVADDLVIFCLWNAQVVALQKKGAAEAWRTRLRDIPGCATTPALAGDRIITGSLDGHLYALDVDNGKILWVFKSPGGFTAPPVISGRHVFVGGYNHFLYAIDVHTGKKVWHANLRSDIIAPVAVVDGLLVVGTRKGRVYAFSGSGAP